MKHIALSLLIAFISVCTSAQNDETAIRKVLQKQQDAWNNGNIELFMEHYLKDSTLSFIGKNDITYGWNQTLERYQKSYPDTATMGKLTFRILHIIKTGKKYRYVVGHWHLKRSKGDVQGHFTLIMRKIKGKWTIISDHSS